MLESLIGVVIRFWLELGATGGPRAGALFELSKIGAVLWAFSFVFFREVITVGGVNNKLFSDVYSVEFWLLAPGPL